MNQLYPIIRRVRLPLLPAEDPLDAAPVPPPEPPQGGATSLSLQTVPSSGGADAATPMLLAPTPETNPPPKGTKPCPKKPSAH